MTRQSRRPAQPIQLLVIDRQAMPGPGGARSQFIVAQLRKAGLNGRLIGKLTG